MNITPRSILPLEISSSRAVEGVALIGGILGLKANDFTTFAPVMFDLFGRAADASGPAIIGKQPIYLEARTQHARARAALRAAFAEGRAFMMHAVNTLKGLLGNRWNGNWAQIGFTNGSLQLPRQPLPILTLLGAYYRTHPGHAVASLNLTSERAEAVKAALVSAQAAVDAAKDAEKKAKQARDAAVKLLRLRMRGLREELRCLLTPEDTRWYRFGFRRPVDGSTPDMIDELNLRPGGEGEVIAEWPPARLAENYRVSWKVADSTDEPTEVGIVSDRQAIIREVPPDTTITVIVTARNASGESAPKQKNITVPRHHESPPFV
jgi:hypothetical protein